MLREEGLDDFLRGRLGRVLREKAPVADVPARADHHQVDAGHAAFHHAGHHVGIHAAVRFDVLPGLHARQRADLVAVQRRFLVMPLRRSVFHALAQQPGDVVLAAFEEQFRAVHVLRVAFRRDQPGARRGAAPDLVQQAGARAVLEHRVLAGAQAEHALQQLDALAHRVGVRERAEMAVALLFRPAVEAQAREGVPGDHQVGVGLVVAEQDVVARREALDEIVLEQQRLGLRARGGDLDARHLRHHHLDARAQALLLEVGADALFQVAGLADVEHLAGVPEHPVDARKVGQSGDERFRFEHHGQERVTGEPGFPVHRL